MIFSVPHTFPSDLDTITSTLVSAVVASSEKGTIGKSTTMTSSRSIVINDMEVTETKPDLRKVTMTITLPMTSSSSSSSSSLPSQSSSAAATAVSSLPASISSSSAVLSPYLLSVSSSARHTSSTAASRYPERSTEANPGLEPLCDKAYRKIGPIKGQSAETKVELVIRLSFVSSPIHHK